MPAWINHEFYDHGDVVVAMRGRQFPVVSVNYSDSLQPGEARGNSPLRLGRTRGTYSAQADITLHTPVWQQLLDTLGRGYMERTFNVAITMSLGPVPTLHVVVLKNCRITNVADSSQSGGEALTTRLTLDPELVIRDGKLPVANAANFPRAL